MSIIMGYVAWPSGMPWLVKPWRHGGECHITCTVIVDKDSGTICAAPTFAAEATAEVRVGGREVFTVDASCGAPISTSVPHDEFGRRFMIKDIRYPQSAGDHGQRITAQGPRNEICTGIDFQPRPLLPRIRCCQCLVAVSLTIEIVGSFTKKRT